MVYKEWTQETCLKNVVRDWFLEEGATHPELKVTAKAGSTGENLEQKHRLLPPDLSEQIAFHQKLNVPYKRGLLHGAPQPRLERELEHWRRGQRCIPGALTLDLDQQPYIS